MCYTSCFSGRGFLRKVSFGNMGEPFTVIPSTSIEYARDTTLLSFTYDVTLVARRHASRLGKLFQPRRAHQQTFAHLAEWQPLPTRPTTSHKPSKSAVSGMRIAT